MSHVGLQARGCRRRAPRRGTCARGRAPSSTSTCTRVAGATSRISPSIAREHQALGRQRTAAGRRGRRRGSARGVGRQAGEGQRARCGARAQARRHGRASARRPSRRAARDARAWRAAERGSTKRHASRPGAWPSLNCCVDQHVHDVDEARSRPRRTRHGEGDAEHRERSARTGWRSRLRSIMRVAVRRARRCSHGRSTRLRAIAGRRLGPHRLGGRHAHGAPHAPTARRARPTTQAADARDHGDDAGRQLVVERREAEVRVVERRSSPSPSHAPSDDAGERAERGDDERPLDVVPGRARGSRSRAP